MSWEKYASSVEDYLRLIKRYGVPFEYIEGNIYRKPSAKAPVIQPGSLQDQAQAEKASSWAAPTVPSAITLE